MPRPDANSAPRSKADVLPKFVVFDMNGTLTDPSGLGDPWNRPDLGLPILATAVSTAMVDALLAVQRPFLEHIRGALEMRARLEGLDLDRVEEAVRRATRLDPFPDTGPALDRLRAAGLPLAVLTNSGAATGRATVVAAGLQDRIELVMGVDAVGSFKPHPSVYAHAVETLRVEPPEILFVAAHAWDVSGAHAAGMRTAWISRGERIFSPVASEPDFRADDLLELADEVVGGAGTEHRHS